MSESPRLLISADRLAEHLKSALNDSGALQWGMTPELAYGRHRGPARQLSRQAAVIVCLVPDGELSVNAHEAISWQIVLTRRPTFLQHHGGQICFPGGKIEAGESPEQAGLREFEEELGVQPQVYRWCGRLPNQYVYASDNDVTPVVVILSRQPAAWQPDPGEVAEVISLPLESLTTGRVVQMTRRVRAIKGHSRQREQAKPISHHFSFNTPTIQSAGYQIWGATAVIMDQLSQCLAELAQCLQSCDKC